jgi:uncharacterized protein DUF547
MSMGRARSATAAVCLIAGLAAFTVAIFRAAPAAAVPQAKPGSPAQGARPGAGPPDYSEWARILRLYYDPARGMDYKGLKAKESANLDKLRRRMAEVDVAALPRPDQLAYWINLYNISVVDTVVDGYPVESIRDLSTDPLIRLNVFKKETVPVKGGALSLNDIENEKIREGFKDPRIHFAINCAAASCPPIRPEPYVGQRLDAQLDEQARSFLNGPLGVKLQRDGDTLVVRTTKIMDWFGDDFDQWGGGKVNFIRRYLPPEKQKLLGGKVKLEYDDYDWKLNDRSR